MIKRFRRLDKIDKGFLIALDVLILIMGDSLLDSRAGMARFLIYRVNVAH